MNNPFDNPDGTFLVLINSEGQYSLWPEFIDVPQGWSREFGPDTRANCLGFVESRWVDMRPRSLADAMDGAQ